MVTAKFKCDLKKENQVYFSAVCTGSEENEKFWQYTPSGQIQMTIDNEAAQDQFEEGEEYYVDFTKA